MDLEELAQKPPGEAERYTISEKAFAHIADPAHRERVMAYAAASTNLTDEMRAHIQKQIWEFSMQMFARCQAAWGADPIAVASAITGTFATAAAIMFETAGPTFTNKDGSPDPVDPMLRSAVPADFLKGFTEDYGRWIVRRNEIVHGRAGQA